MPGNHTTNYQLSQWAADDRVQMADFNADNAKIDAALKAETDARAAGDAALQAAVSGKADSSTVAALQTAVNGKADSSTVAALQTAVNAKASAAALNALSQTVNTKGNCRIVTGQYSGAGKSSNTLTFDKPPLVVMISDVAILFSIRTCVRAIYVTNLQCQCCDASWSGNSVTFYNSECYTMNSSGRTYTYVALLEA